ncbi:MAG TPA: tripartite tricarboxylate transporter TctB family protein [Burkholderiaceae bacterium]|nr:tripartite tricarboxylate transporter TctB family protein [Burkholderiaceae bacterium]
MRSSGVCPRGQQTLRAVEKDDDRRSVAVSHSPSPPAEKGGVRENATRVADGRERPGVQSDEPNGPEARTTWREILPYGISAIVAAWLYHVSDGFAESGMPGRIGPDAWPKIALGLMFFVSCLGMIKVWLKMRGTLAPTRANSDMQALNPPQLYPRLVWIAVLATVAYVWAWQVLGYFLSTILYSLVLMLIGRQRHPVVLLCGSVGFAVFFLFLFMKVVYVALPLGERPFSQVSLALMSLLGIR